MYFFPFHVQSNDGFPCCWGTLTEQFSKFSDSIYFQSPDYKTIYVNQFIGSTVFWRQQNVKITQKSNFPVTTNPATVITVNGAATFSMRIRVPRWTDASASQILVNGQSVGRVQAGQYFDITRAWADGDVVTVVLSMTFSLSMVRDDRDEYNTTTAFMYGPLALAGIDSPSNTFLPSNEWSNPSTYLKRVSDSELVFSATGTRLMKPFNITLIPLYQVMNERYTVYFNLKPDSYIPYTPGGASVPSLTANDYSFGGGSGIVESRVAGLQDIRSGNPNEVNQVLSEHLIYAPGHSIKSFSMTFRYLAGYQPPQGQTVLGSNFTVSFLNVNTGKVGSAVYSSPVLDKYSFDDYTTYSPAIQVAASGLSIANDDPLQISLTFYDNARNLQFMLQDKIGLNFTISWN